VKKSSSWILYILRCGDGSFYTGITNRLDHRLKAHEKGLASRYTRSRLPVRLIYRKACRSRSDALKKEWAVKLLSREKKERLIFFKESIP